MLHDAGQHQSRLCRRYRHPSDRDGVRVAVEDEITSTVLGPLELLPAADVLKVICALLRAAGINTAEDRCQDDVELAFWPRRKVADLQRAVEPDCYVTFRWR